MNYKKNYIGKGKQIADMDIVSVTIPVKNIEGLTHKWEGNEYLTFEIARMKAPDEYGRTHTCYVSTREDKVEEIPAPEPKAKGRKAKKEEPVMETENSELPI